MPKFSASRQKFLGQLLAGAAALAAAPKVWTAEPAASAHSLTGTLATGAPSRTARGAALLRAAHQLFDVPRVFEDPLALAILGPDAEGALRADATRGASSRSLRALVALRSRHAEDALAAAYQRGVRQYVVLGAGLDTFGYRNPFAPQLHVFEVDHPATQGWKRARLAASGISPSPGLHFAPVDFERQTLSAGLTQAGFRIDQPAFVSLLGVVMYLSRDAARETLKFAATLQAGSEIVFDYGVPDSALSPAELAARQAAAARVASIGEPWLTWFDPAALAIGLRGLGFSVTDDLDPAAANARYFAHRDDGLAVSRSVHVMRALV